MNAATIPWGALLTESMRIFLLLFGLGLGFIGLWSLWSQRDR